MSYKQILTTNDIGTGANQVAAGNHTQAYTSSECTTYTSDDNKMGVTPAAVKKAFTIFEPKPHNHDSSYIINGGGISSFINSAKENQNYYWGFNGGSNHTYAIPNNNMYVGNATKAQILQHYSGSIPLQTSQSLEYISGGFSIGTNPGQCQPNSGVLNGLGKEDAINTCLKYLEDNHIGKKTTNYRLQDWIFSRQRFWGEPIPMIYCDDCGWVPVPEEELPLVLPDVKSYEPTDNGESPLSTLDEWVNVPCPHCGKMAKRETDTMPNWAGSSWYWIRYMDPNNDKEFASRDAMDYWGQVDYYNGGMEHATRHLLYARFWNQFLYDQGLVSVREPFKKRVAHGMILGENNEKMSKSKGNVVNPDDMVANYGADALRTYEMFIGDYPKDAAWSENGLKGCKKFLERVDRIKNKLTEGDEYSKNLESLMHKTIKKVTNDLLSMKYNTAVSALMILLNAMEKEESITHKDYRTLLALLNPIAPHITEELNEECKLGEELAVSAWPEYDESKTTDSEFEIGVQVNGKLRGSVLISEDDSEEEIKTKALNNENVKKYTDGLNIVKVIVVPKRIVSVVVK